MMGSSGQGVDLREAAAELGVHYQTAYRWVRTGRLRSQQVDGRYLITQADIAELNDERTRPQQRATTSQRRMIGAADKMYSALVEGDELTARHITHAVLSEGTPVIKFIADVMVPPLRRIGDGWRSGDLPIWVEHRASSTCERMLGDIAPSPRGRRRGTAMVAAVEGDRHALPASMAAVALRANNWRVHHLGADIPTAELVSFTELHDVDIAVLTRTNPQSEPVAAEAAGLIAATGTPVIVGAPGRTLEQLIDEARDAIHRAPTATT